MECIIEKINTNKLEIVGKTMDSSTYSGDVGSRAEIGRCFIATADVADGMTVRGDKDDTPIRKVKEVESLDVFVQLLGAEGIADGRALNADTLRNVYVSKSVENPGMTDVFVMRGTNSRALNGILQSARLLADTDTGRRARCKWYPCDADDARLVIRVCGKIGKNGLIVTDDAGDETF